MRRAVVRSSLELTPFEGRTVIWGRGPTWASGAAVAAPGRAGIPTATTTPA
jgi:hypothetical protein